MKAAPVAPTVFAVGTALAVTGLAKVWATVGDARMLGIVDPILGMPWKQLLAGVGVLEIIVATICFFGRSQQLGLALTAWLSTNFLVYRIGLWWIGWKQPCGCLGNLTQALNITPHTADTIAKCLLGFLIIASYGALLALWRTRKNQELESLKSRAGDDNQTPALVGALGCDVEKS
jgi:hypothetical protein